MSACKNAAGNAMKIGVLALQEGPDRVGHGQADANELAHLGKEVEVARVPGAHAFLGVVAAHGRGPKGQQQAASGLSPAVVFAMERREIGCGHFFR